ncbi:hypothetical protein [Adlercreutzia caecimuris]|uniref:Uncharacterized protein n=1 Tax=Adlercreutzia caecimuris TaxID=671266 RepID=A0A4S4G0D7_9ACTN|nr:hypothetical protein [Adlercreutzia caecimuris]THG36879.1 hypothetical protein E5986_08230 [Adlercreutzia caecimuris]
MTDEKINAVAVLAASALASGLATTTEEASDIAVEWYEQLRGKMSERTRRLADEVNAKMGF